MGIFNWIVHFYFSFWNKNWGKIWILLFAFVYFEFMEKYLHIFHWFLDYLKMRFKISWLKNQISIFVLKKNGKINEFDFIFLITSNWWKNFFIFNLICGLSKNNVENLLIKKSIYNFRIWKKLFFSNLNFIFWFRLHQTYTETFVYFYSISWLS